MLSQASRAIFTAAISASLAPSHVLGQLRAQVFRTSRVSGFFFFFGGDSSRYDSIAEMTVITPDSQGYSHSNGAAAEEDIVNIANAYDTM